MVNSRSTGAAGEREAAKWLQSKFKLEKAPERNLEQARSGGFDLIGFPPFAWEVKRCEQVDKRGWWLQAKTSTTDKYSIPVVMFRKNKGKWKFLISVNYIGLPTGFLQLEEREFILWAKNILRDLGNESTHNSSII